MTAPTASWTTIPNSDIDPESPITTGLMTAIRDNAQHLKEWIGKDYTAAQNHNHDGTNSALLPASVFGNLYAYHRYT